MRVFAARRHRRVAHDVTGPGWPAAVWEAGRLDGVVSRGKRPRLPRVLAQGELRIVNDGYWDRVLLRLVVAPRNGPEHELHRHRLAHSVALGDLLRRHREDAFPVEVA